MNNWSYTSTPTIIDHSYYVRKKVFIDFPPFQNQLQLTCSWHITDKLPHSVIIWIHVLKFHNTTVSSLLELRIFIKKLPRFLIKCLKITNGWRMGQVVRVHVLQMGIQHAELCAPATYMIDTPISVKIRVTVLSVQLIGLQYYWQTEKAVVIITGRLVIGDT